MGMRGTGSHTIHFEDVFVPDAAIALDRPRAGWPPVWSVVLTVAAPLYVAPYVGVADAAVERAVNFARPRSKDPMMQLLVGELENERASLGLAFRALVENARNYDFAPELARANQALRSWLATMVATNAVASHCARSCPTPNAPITVGTATLAHSIAVLAPHSMKCMRDTEGRRIRSSMV